MDEARTEAFKKAVPASRQAGKISVVYGYGSLIPELRELYDVKVATVLPLVIGRNSSSAHGATSA